MLADATLLNLATTKVVILLAMASSVGCFAVVLMRLLAAPFRRLKAGPRHLCAALAALMLVCLVWAQKSGDGGDDGDSSGGTNDVTQVSGTNDTDDAGLDGMGPLMMMGSIAPDLSPAIDATDIARGYRLESSTVNGQISYEMPEGVSPAGTWHLTGAYDDVLSVDLDGFVFPLGRELCSSLWAHTWGTARTHLRNQTNELVAVGTPMSALPGFSRFWTAQTTNDTFLLTWENFTLGRIPVSSNDSSLIPDPSSLLSAQLELFRSGDFIARSNDVESVYRRINPDDWDDDGDPNEDDINPVVCDGSHFGPHQVLSEGANSNAYCWVDLVVRQANARMVFSGDGASDLPDPCFIAKAGETNRVIILIGKTYVVTCDMPFEVVGKSDGEIGEWWEADRKLWLNWPVEIWSHGDDEMPLLLMGAPGLGSHGPRSFTMLVSPSNLGGGFTWTNSCCSISGAGLNFSYSCHGTCHCGGCCAMGFYGYEGYRLGANGGSCGCTYEEDDSDPHDPAPDDGPYAAGISLSFSEPAVIFEDRHENTPGCWVEKQSTVSILSCIVHGGPNGGTATFALTGKDKLDGLTLPESIAVPAGCRVAYEIPCRGKLQSGNAEDIIVAGTFVENAPNSMPTTHDVKLTSVRVELSPENQAPSNPSPHRHVYGVNEYVNTQCFPADVTLEWQDGDIDVAIGGTSFHCPWTGGSYQPKAIICGVEYRTTINVEEPHVVCRYATWNGDGGVYGTAGGVGMNLALFVEPTYVSFEGLYLAEIPDESSCPHWGYFNDVAKGGPLSHTVSAGAGHWIAVGAYGFWAMDSAGVNEYVRPWSDGGKVWNIPVGWGNAGVERGRVNPNPTQQEFEITAYGTVTVRKYGHEISRTVTCGVIMDGICVHDEEYHE